MPTQEVIDLTDRVFLLRDQLAEGKVKVAPHLVEKFRESLQKIEIDSDGYVVPSSVDGFVRSFTIGLKYFRHRDETKRAISLSQIQQKYFEILSANFGEMYEAMAAAGGNPNSMAHFLSEKVEFVEDFSKNIAFLVKDLEEFWTVCGEATYFHLEDSKVLKAVFGGDLFPSYERNIASSTALYVDTIVLPCPITHAARLIEYWKPEKAAYFIIKHALNALSYRELALAELDPPIVVIVPDLELLDTGHTDLIRARAEPAALRHASILFGEGFDSIDEVKKFLDELNDPSSIIERIRDPKLFLFDDDWGKDPAKQLAKFLADTRGNFGGFDQPDQLGKLIFSQLVGRMMQASSIELKSARLFGTPLIDAQTSWRYLNWKMQHDASKSQERDHPSQEMHIVHALQSEQEKGLLWLGNIPKSSLIELRKGGHTEEIREMLSKGVAGLVQANPDNFFRTSGQVVENLDVAFLRHQKVLHEARDKQLKVLGLDLGSCLAVGGISVAAAITGHPAVGVASSMLGIAGLPTLKDLKSDFKAWQELEKKAATTPTGILFKHLDS